MRRENSKYLLAGESKLIESNHFEQDIVTEKLAPKIYKPSFSHNKDIILESLGLPTISTTDYDLDTSEIGAINKNSSIKNQNVQNLFQNEVSFQRWKLIENLSSKLLSVDECTIVLECLIDRDNQIYEERQFKREPLFNGYDLSIGALFKICLYERDNQTMIEIKADPNLVLESDFPNIDFFEKFGKMKLNKKIGDKI